MNAVPLSYAADVCDCECLMFCTAGVHGCLCWLLQAVMNKIMWFCTAGVHEWQCACCILQVFMNDSVCVCVCVCVLYSAGVHE